MTRERDIELPHGVFNSELRGKVWNILEVLHAEDRVIDDMFQLQLLGQIVGDQALRQFIGTDGVQQVELIHSVAAPSVRRPDRANRRSQPQRHSASQRLACVQADECLHCASAALSRLPHQHCRCRLSLKSSSQRALLLHLNDALWDQSDSLAGAIWYCADAIPGSLNREGTLLMNDLDLNDVRTFVAVGTGGHADGCGKGVASPCFYGEPGVDPAGKAPWRPPRAAKPQRSCPDRLGKGVPCNRADARCRPSEDGGELLEGRRTSPSGLIKVACPFTMARDVLAPLLKEFLGRYPICALRSKLTQRVGIRNPGKTWTFSSNCGRRRIPCDACGHIQALFEGFSPAQAISRASGSPATPDDLTAHICVGSGTWKLSRGKKIATPNILFRVVSAIRRCSEARHQRVWHRYSAPMDGETPDVRDGLIPVLPQWTPEPITLCALFLRPIAPDT
jgi:LysR family transcriptional regulator, transcriptional activator for dmlA